MTKYLNFWVYGLTLIIFLLLIEILRLEKFDHDALLTMYSFQQTYLSKAKEGYQMAIQVAPDGSAYIPIIFKDKVTSEKYFDKAKYQWTDDRISKNGYYAIEKLFMPYENKRK